MNFNNKVIIVTGSSGNLGGEIAKMLLDRGASLVLPVRSVKKLLNRSPEFKGQLLIDEIDLTREEDTQKVVEITLSSYGHIDALIHTVGGYKAGILPGETALDLLHDMLSINLISTFNINRSVINVMVSQGYGRIVNTAARSGVNAGARDMAYSIAKSGVIRLTESYSRAYKHNGIVVNCVIPGTLDTPENRQAMPDAQHGRWVNLSDIAQVYLFLVSDDAWAIQGAVIPVYGAS